MSAQGRPKREFRPLGGSAAAKPQAWGGMQARRVRPKTEPRPAGRDDARVAAIDMKWFGRRKRAKER
jgi:hypothetical protein